MNGKKKIAHGASNQDEKISVIMAAYNAEKTIAESMRSALEQSYRNLELIVVDDASTDATLSVARSFAQRDDRVRVISCAHNGGVCAARKRGLANAKGEWISILDSDDFWELEKLELQMLTQRETRADLVYTGSAFVDEMGTRKKWCLRVPETVTYRDLLKQNIVSNSSVLVKKTLFEKYFVESDRLHEDFATWLRLLKDGAVFRGIDQPLLIYRVRKSSKSGDKRKSALMNWNTYRYVGLNIPVSCYYMLHYAFRGFLKYRCLQQF